MAADRIVLHIGTHKTGSTSIQHFLRDNEDLLASVGATYPPGMVLDVSHSELPLLAVRPDRTWPARIRFPETRQAGWLAAARGHLRDQIAGSPLGTLVYSHEDLSYLRFDDELSVLHEILEGLPVRVVVFLRAAADFLRSYGAQLQATGFETSDVPTSFAYVASDSWLVDYVELVAAYRRQFGEANVEVIDYDAVLRADGSAIPAFTDVLQIPRQSLPALDRYFLNRAGVQLRPTKAQLAAIRSRLAEQAK